MYEGGPITDSMIPGASFKFDGSSSVGGASAIRPAHKIEQTRFPGIYATPEEVKALRLSALGYDTFQLARKMKTGPSHVIFLLQGIRAELGRGEEITTTEAIVRALDAGVLQVGRMVREVLDESVFYKLSPRQAEFIKALAETGATDIELASRFGVSVNYFSKTLEQEVFPKLGIRKQNRARNRAITYYKEAERRARIRAAKEGIDPAKVDPFYFKPPSDIFTPTERKFFDMRVKQGLSYGEIAEREEVKPRSVIAVVYRARKKLRKDSLQ